MPSPHVRTWLVVWLLVFAATILTVSRVPAAIDQSGIPYNARWHTYATLPSESGTYLFSNPAQDHLYLYSEYSGIAVYDSKTAKFIGNIPYYHNPNATLSHDGSRLYFSISDDTFTKATIYAYDTTTLSEDKTLLYHCPPSYQICGISSMAEAPDGRLFISLQFKPVIDILDGNTGEVLDSFKINILENYSWPVLAIHDDALYVGSSYFEELDGAGIGFYDISDPTVDPVPVAFLPFNDNPQSIRVSHDGSLVTVIGYGSATQIRASDFKPIWTINNFIEGVFPNGDVLVSEDHPSAEAKIVSQLDGETGDVVRGDILYKVSGWGHYEAIAPISDGGIAIDFGTEIQMRSPSSNVIALPLLFSRACPGGNVIDDFNNPASGWPVGENNNVRVQYADGSYKIELLKSDQWVAFSRGDNWWNGTHFLALAAPRAGFQGTVGIVFGLNEDWTDFYSFEIYPAEELWILLHYHQGGWELLDIKPTTYVSLQSPFQIELRPKVDGGGALEVASGSHSFITVPKLNGRVGLSVRSFDVPVTAYFEKYIFSGENCDPMEVRSATADMAPNLAPHPTLEEMMREMDSSMPD